MTSKQLLKLREYIEALGGDPDTTPGERFSDLEVFGTPASPSINYETSPGTSTQIIEAVFMSQYGMYQPMLGDITERRQMGDGQGAVKQYLEIDPPLPPAELEGGVAPILATMSSRGYSVRPLQYGVGFRLLGIKKRDSQLDEAAWLVNEIGARFAYWPEREMVRLVLNPLDWLAGTPMFLGADNIRLFSAASHTYATSGETFATPAPSAATVTYGNVITGTGGGANKIYSAVTQVQTDFFAARANILNRRDAHGELITVEQPGGKWHAICNALEPTTSRYLRAAFTETARPSDDSLRDALHYGVTVHECPLFNGVGGTIGVTEYGDWVLCYMAPGKRPPVFILEREGLRQGYEVDTIGDFEQWAWTIRTGVGYGDARCCVLINQN